jgi:hypothetical protein
MRAIEPRDSRAISAGVLTLPILITVGANR